MRRRKIYACECGRWLSGKVGKWNKTYCSLCSPYAKESHEIIEPTFLLTNEISEGNIDLRLKEGFRLLQE